MKEQETVSRYRRVDLSLFALMLTVFEGIVVTAATRWFPGQPFSVSIVPAIIAVVLVRWGPWAAIHAVLGGAVTCFFSRGGASQYLIYCLGNLCSLGALAAVRLAGEEKIRENAANALLFGVFVLGLIQLGRAAVSLALGMPAEGAALFFTTAAVTDLFTLVVLWIVRRLDGVLEDQRHYLNRLRREQEKERGGYP